MSSSREASLFYLPGTSDYLPLLAGDWLQFVKLRLPQLETAFILLFALLFVLIVLKRNLSIEAVGLANGKTRYRSPRLKAVKVADYFLSDNVQDFGKQEDPSKAVKPEGKKWTKESKTCSACAVSALCWNIKESAHFGREGKPKTLFRHFRRIFSV